MVTKSRARKRDSRVQSPKPSFLEQATYYADGDSFFEAVKDSDEESPKNAVVAVEEGRLPASILDFAEENGYAFYYIMSDGSEVGLQKTPEKKDITIGVLLDDG
jgi:hypothetical protein